MDADTLFRHGIETLANRHELMLAGMRLGHKNPPPTEARLMAAVADVRYEMKARVWEDISSLDYCDVDFNEIPALYMEQLYIAIREEIEDTLGEHIDWRIDVPTDTNDTGVRVDGHLIFDHKAWREHLIEQSGFHGYVNTLSLISRHEAFNPNNIIMVALKQRGAVQVINETLLPNERLEGLDLDMPVRRLPLEIQANIAAAYLIKILIETHFNDAHKNNKIVILDNGLRLSLHLVGDDSVYIETPDHTCRQAIEIDIYDIDQIASFVA